MINKVILVGNLGKDAEVFNGGTGPVVKLSIATNENRKNKKGEWESIVTWHTIICFGNSAERTKDYKKGWMVSIEGKIHYREHEEKYYTDIVCDYSKVLKKESTKEEAKQDDVPAWAR